MPQIDLKSFVPVQKNGNGAKRHYLVFDETTWTELTSAFGTTSPTAIATAVSALVTEIATEPANV